MLRAVHFPTAFRTAPVAVVAFALMGIALLTNDAADAAANSALAGRPLACRGGSDHLPRHASG